MIKNDGIFVYDETGWFVGRNDGVLYKLNLEDYLIDPVWNISDKKTKKFRLYQKCVANDEYVICMPDNEVCLGIYNTKQKSYRKITINSVSERICMVNGWIHDDIFIGISHVKNKILMVDLKTSFIRWIAIPCKQVGYQCAFDGEKQLYIPCQNATKIILFDVVNEIFEEKTVNIDDKGFNTVTLIDKESILLTGYKKNIYLLKKDLCSFVDIEESLFAKEQGEENEERPLFGNCEMLKDKVYLFPWNAGNERCYDVLIYDIYSKRIESLLNKTKIYGLNKACFMCGCVYQDSIFLFGENEKWSTDVDVPFYRYNVGDDTFHTIETAYCKEFNHWNMLFEPGTVSIEKGGQLELFIKTLC